MPGKGRGTDGTEGPCHMTRCGSYDTHCGGAHDMMYGYEFPERDEYIQAKVRSAVPCLEQPKLQCPKPVQFTQRKCSPCRPADAEKTCQDQAMVKQTSVYSAGARSGGGPRNCSRLCTSHDKQTSELCPLALRCGYKAFINELGFRKVREGSGSLPREGRVVGNL